MSVFYKLAQDNRKNSKHKGMYYAHAVNLGTKTLTDMASVIQRNCTVKKSDTLAVLSELSEVMADFLMQGYRVKIDGLGAFKVGLKSTAALSEDDFNASKNIVGARINFVPESDWDRAERKHRKVALEGMEVENLKEKLEAKKKKDDTSSNG